ncbi:hypothetical protein AwDysgo_17020 [Bacteroidales bacterium]|nr:hypothetical protein AwDysgo_17020 [Bacteroidales bacterium]
MNIEELREYCLSQKASAESLPFDDNYLVFKVMDKMFALTSLNSPELAISLKCDPELAIELRERYACVVPAYHFNKKYWNTIYLNKEMDDYKVKKWITHSVEQVINKLPKKVKALYLEL